MLKLLHYNKDLHLEYLKKWLGDEKLMAGWDMPPFWGHVAEEWTEEKNKVILMIFHPKLNKIIGFVNFYDWNKTTHIVSRGTLIDPEFQGKGFGKKAIKLSNKYAFEKMHVKRIELYVAEANTISRHITEKLGYTFDRYDSKKKRFHYYMDINS